MHPSHGSSDRLMRKISLLTFASPGHFQWQVFGTVIWRGDVTDAGGRIIFASYRATAGGRAGIELALCQGSDEIGPADDTDKFAASRHG
jgi:hypothetical protein